MLFNTLTNTDLRRMNTINIDMSIFKSTQEVYQTAFEEMPISPIMHKRTPPLWHKDRLIEFNDVVTWEQIYGKHGISLYAAWSPYSEYYIIVHGLFLGTDAGIEEFWGRNSIESIVSRFEDFGIQIPINQYWTPS